MQTAESPEDYTCTKCAPGSVPDPQAERECHKLIDIDVEYDTSSNNMTGM